MEVLRHVDAGYDEAMSFGAQHGVHSPMSAAGRAG
jgi:urocanate hydratase